MAPEATDPGRQANGGRGRAGDDNAPCDRRQWFRHTVLRLLDRLYGTALRLTGNRTQAEDLVAETVARAWAELEDQLQDTPRLEGWLLHVLSSTFIRDWHQRCCRGGTVIGHGTRAENGDADEHLSPSGRLHTPLPHGRGTQSERLLDTLLRDDVARALDGLPEDERTAVVLVEIQGHRRTEVAEMLQAPADTVRARLSRGRARLREALWQLADDTGSPGPAPP